MPKDFDADPSRYDLDAEAPRRTPPAAAPAGHDRHRRIRPPHADTAARQGPQAADPRPPRRPPSSAERAWYGHGYWTAGRFMVGTDDAYVQADFAVVAPKISGYVARVAAADNQAVRAGDPLVVLEDGDYRDALALAEAQLAAQQAAVARIDAQAAAAEASIAQARARVDAARRPRSPSRRRPRALPEPRPERRRHRPAAGGGRGRAGLGPGEPRRGRGRRRDRRGQPQGDRRAEGRGRGDDRRLRRLARQGRARPRRHRAPRALRRHRRQPLGRRRRPRRARQAAARRRAARRGLRRGELQGDPDRRARARHRRSICTSTPSPTAT